MRNVITSYTWSLQRTRTSSKCYEEARCTDTCVYRGMVIYYGKMTGAQGGVGGTCLVEVEYPVSFG